MDKKQPWNNPRHNLGYRSTTWWAMPLDLPSVVAQFLEHLLLLNVSLLNDMMLLVRSPINVLLHCCIDDITQTKHHSISISTAKYRYY